jgi:GntR family transcriptional regulator
VTARVIPLARDSRVAMYRQLAGQLREAILGGRYKVDDRIPTEPELIRRYGVSRITARQAVDALAREGLVVRQQGKGTFVRAPTVHHDLLDLRGIYDGLVAQGLEPKTELLDFRRAVPPPRVAEQLGTGPRKLLRWRRLYVLRGKPFAVTDVHLNAGRAQLTREQVDRNPTYSILETILKERVGRADVSIRYAQAAPELARALGLARGAPLMAFERVSYSAGGVPLEHSLYYARAEAYEFSLTVRGKLPITRSLKAASR